MSDIHMVGVEPDGIHGEGDVISLPETVGRVDAWHDTRPARGTNFEMTVVGRGDLKEYVLLSTGGTNPTVEDGAQILATDVETATLWYCLPRSAWGGSA